MSGRGIGCGSGCRGCRGDRVNQGKGEGQQSGDKDTATTKTRKTLADHIYYVGSTRQARNYSVITDVLINHIFQIFKNGNDISKALETCEAIYFTKVMPKLQESTATDVAEKTRQEKQFETLYKAEVQRFLNLKDHDQNNLDKAFAIIWSQ
jgi:hypothetical protein